MQIVVTWTISYRFKPKNKFWSTVAQWNTEAYLRLYIHISTWSPSSVKNRFVFWIPRRLLDLVKGYSKAIWTKKKSLLSQHSNQMQGKSQKTKRAEKITVSLSQKADLLTTNRSFSAATFQLASEKKKTLGFFSYSKFICISILPLYDRTWGWKRNTDLVAKTGLGILCNHKKPFLQ